MNLMQTIAESPLVQRLGYGLVHFPVVSPGRLVGFAPHPVRARALL